MRSRISIPIFFFLTLFFVKTSLIAQLQPYADKSILLVYGGWEGHNPEGFKDLFLPWLESKGFNVTVSNTLDVYSDKDKMKQYDLIIQSWTMGTLSKEQEAGLIEAVKNGTGLAGCHGGLGDSFRSNTNYLFMVGGQFAAHPGGKIKYKVNIVTHEDSITKGINDFELTSEQYYMLVDPGVEVLATTTFKGEHANWIKNVQMPVVWKKKFGKGKVFYSSIGHSMKCFDIYEVMEIMERGILWAIRDK